MKLLIALAIIFSFFSCDNGTAKSIEANTKEENSVKSKTIAQEFDQNIESFADSSKIAFGGKYKLEILQKTIDTNTTVKFKLFKKLRKEWNEIQSFEIDKCCSIPLLTEISDFNNDGLNDFTIHYSTSARGANDIRKLFMFENDRFIEIKNSDLFSNLSYNKKLNCINSLEVYAGATTLFLKLEKDSLREFAKVDYIDGHAQSYLIKKGKEIKLKSKKSVSDSPIVSFSNYNPIEE